MRDVWYEHDKRKMKAAHKWKDARDWKNTTNTQTYRQTYTVIYRHKRKEEHNGNRREMTKTQNGRKRNTHPRASRERKSSNHKCGQTTQSHRRASSAAPPSAVYMSAHIYHPVRIGEGRQRGNERTQRNASNKQKWEKERTLRSPIRV